MSSTSEDGSTVLLDAEEDAEDAEEEEEEEDKGALRSGSRGLSWLFR